MGLATWIKPGEGTSQKDLEQQLEHAHAALAKATASAERAREAFDADPSTEPALRKALDAQQGAKLHAERADRLLEHARQAEAAHKRAELEKRRDQLQLELTAAALEEQRRPLAEQEAKLLIELAQLRAMRRDFEIGVRRKAHDLVQTKHSLSEAVPTHFMDTFTFEPPQALVRERLEHFISTQPLDAEARRYADRLRDQLTGSFT